MKKSHSMNTKILAIIGFILVLIPLGLKGQSAELSDIKPNAIFVEFYLVRPDFSNGFLSLNYERIVGGKKNKAFRLGIYPDEFTISFPITFCWISRPLKNNHFEIGLGGTYRIEKYNGNFIHDMPSVIVPLMYRHQKSEGWFFRGGINLFVSWPTIPSPTLGFGYKF